MKFETKGDNNKIADIEKIEKPVDIKVLVSLSCTMCPELVTAAQRIAAGEAEYMRILAEAYDTQEKKDFYEFILALEALKASLTGDNKTVILDADSELAKILMGLGK